MSGPSVAGLETFVVPHAAPALRACPRNTEKGVAFRPKVYIRFRYSERSASREYEDSAAQPGLDVSGEGQADELPQTLGYHRT